MCAYCCYRTLSIIFAKSCIDLNLMERNIVTVATITNPEEVNIGITS